jgi:hypothetical protein
MSQNEESATGRSSNRVKFPLEAWYMLSISGFTAAQMREITMHYIIHLKEVAQSEVDLYNKYLEVLDRLESKV